MSETSVVFIVDDDRAVRESLSLILEVAGWAVEDYASAEAFLDAYQDDRPACLLLDVRMPGMSGLELQKRLAERGVALPIIFISGHADVPTSVSAMRSGALDFLEKPFRKEQLLQRIHEALARAERLHAGQVERRRVLERLAHLTPREREVMALVVAGKSNKEIGRILGTSHRTVDIQRARVMEKMAVNSPQELTALAVRFGLCGAEA
ncbi:MAG: DNA-binding response regulator [Proteobacteria bacterium]|nr:MAG: DNA-binding response regulator [Pseudomonadota bacterium]